MAPEPIQWLSKAMALGCILGLGTVYADEPKVDFARDIQPILAQHCAACHGPDEKTRKAELRFDVRAVAVARKAIVPGEPKSSKLIARIEAADQAVRMPPAESKKPLSDRQRQLLRTWIEQGAAYSQHWAFTSPRRPVVPEIPNATIRNPIDAFILQRLQREGLQPSPEADRATLLRRASLDLTGLPPTLPELDKFLTDNSPTAYEKAVDRLLASPRYAERMALAWLDAARYADTNGFNNDEDRTQWPWRDWVIDAFQRNLPYDQFIVEQLAGDLLPNSSLSQKVATAFHRNQAYNTEGGIIPEEYRVEYVADRVHTTATVFLGLSMQCARCHDHKFDPISQREYYQFYAFFNSVVDRPTHAVNLTKGEPFVRVPSPDQPARLEKLEQQRLGIEKRLKQREDGIDEAAARWEKNLTKDDLQKLAQSGLLLHLPLDDAKRNPAHHAQLRSFYLERIDAEAKKLRGELADVLRQKAEVEKATPALMIMQDLPKPRDTFLLKRGQYDQPGEKVGVGVPAILPVLPNDAPRNRLGLAQWLVHPSNPLTARVAVNRWWQAIFGTGLVKTVEDFGVTGELPSHPELLDWLATELVRTGWDVKAMQKLIVMSVTYRQSSRMRNAEDPENRLLARGARMRLSAETVRDNALAISGLLRDRIGGPSVKPYQPSGLWEDVTVNRQGKYVADKGDNLYRRSMYTFWKRTCPPPSLMSFDAPNREVCVSRRAVTNTPLHALVLLNDPTHVEAARKLAERMMIEGGKTAEERLTLAFRCAVARSPNAAESRILLKIYDEALKVYRGDKDAARKVLAVGESPRDPTLDEAELAAWAIVASTILNLDETISKR